MNRITRMIAITGLGLFAGITIGAGPAMAATNTEQGAVKSSTADKMTKPGDHVAGYYDSSSACNFAGRIGERLGRWDDWHCYPSVGGGWHDGDWALVVDYSGGMPNGHHRGFPSGNRHHGGFPSDHGHHGGPSINHPVLVHN